MTQINILDVDGGFMCNKKHILAIFLIALILLFSVFFTGCSGKEDFVVIFDVGGEAYHTVRIGNEGYILRPDNPTKVGYVFEGWYERENPDSLWDFSRDTVIKSMILVARWQGVSINVAFDSEGGSSLPDMTVAYGDAYSFRVPTKKGYVFEGWENKDKVLLTDEKGNSKGVWNLLADAEVYARWTVSSSSTGLELLWEENSSLFYEVWKNSVYLNGLGTILIKDSFSNVGKKVLVVSKDGQERLLAIEFKNEDSMLDIENAIDLVMPGDVNLIRVDNQNIFVLNDLSFSYILTGDVALENHVYFDSKKEYLIRYVGSEKEYVIPEGVKTIASYAFNNCPNLSRVIIPRGVDLVEKNAFYSSSLVVLANDIEKPEIWDANWKIKAASVAWNYRGNFDFTSPLNVLISGSELQTYSFNLVDVGAYILEVNRESYENLEIELYNDKYEKVSCIDISEGINEFKQLTYLTESSSYYLEVSSLYPGDFSFVAKKVKEKKVGVLEEVSTIESPSILHVFRAEESGIYRLSSHGELDTSITLYDQDYNEIIYSSSNGKDDNFSLLANLVGPSMYYLELSSTTPGSFSYTIEKGQNIKENTLINVSIDNSETRLYSFATKASDPLISTYFKIESYGDLDARIKIYDSKLREVKYLSLNRDFNNFGGDSNSSGGNGSFGGGSSGGNGSSNGGSSGGNGSSNGGDFGGDSNNFGILVSLVSSSMYFFEISSDMFGSFSFDVEEVVEVEEESLVTFEMKEGGFALCFFLLEEGGLYKIESYGDLGKDFAILSLLDGNLQKIAYLEAEGSEGKFKYIVELEGASLYYLEGYSSMSGKLSFDIQMIGEIEEGRLETPLMRETEEEPEEGDLNPPSTGEIEEGEPEEGNLDPFSTGEAEEGEPEEGSLEPPLIREDFSRLYIFRAKETGLYKIESYGGLNTSIILYDSRLNEIISKEADETSGGFRLHVNLLEGFEYYLEVSSPPSEEFRFDVQKVKKIEEGSLETLSISESQYKLYSFRPYATGAYKIASYGNLKTKVILYDREFNEISTSEEGFPNFRLWSNLETSVLYYISVFSGESGEFSFDVKKYNATEGRDGSLIGLSILENQTVLYDFMPREAGIYKIESYGNLDILVVLYDSEFNEILSNDAFEKHFNIRGWASLETLTLYYVEVSSYATGNASFDIKKYTPKEVQEENLIEVSILEKQTILYEFTPKESGMYKVETYGDLNIIIAFYDQEFNRIRTSGGSGQSFNCKQWVSLEGLSLYYIDVYSAIAGDFTFDIEKYLLREVTEATLEEVSILENESILYVITPLEIDEGNELPSLPEGTQPGPNAGDELPGPAESGQEDPNAGDELPDSAEEIEVETLCSCILEFYGDLDIYFILYDSEFNEIISNYGSEGGYNSRHVLSLDKYFSYYLEVFSSNSGEFSFDLKRAVKVEAEISLPVAIQEEEAVWSYFSSEEAGFYVLESYGDLNTQVTLYDSELNEISSNDDGRNKNFKLWFNLLPETLYFARIYSYDEGNFSYSFKKYVPKELDESSLDDLSMSGNQRILYKFFLENPEDAGIYKIESYGKLKAQVTLYDSEFSPIFSFEDGKENFNFKRLCHLEAPFLYYIEIHSYTAGKLSFDIKKYLPEEITEGSFIEYEVLEEQSVLYELSLGSSGIYKIESYGDLNAQAILYDSEFNIITSSGDDGSGKGFKLWCSLEEEFLYYIEVTVDSVGEFSFNIEKYLPQELEENDLTEVTILEKDSLLYLFTSREAGIYKIEFYGDSSTLIILYDSEFNEIISNAVGGQNFNPNAAGEQNFNSKLEWSVEEASFYYIELYSSTSGEFSFDIGRITEIEAGILMTISKGDERPEWISFIPEKEGLYSIELYGISDIADIEIFLSDSRKIDIDYVVYAYRDRNLKLLANFEEAKSHYIAIFSHTTGEFFLKIEEVLEIEEGSIEEVSTLAKESRLYKFTLEDEGIYKLESYGDLGVFLVLYDSDFNEVILNNYGGQNSNFKQWINLEMPTSQTFYIEVASYAAGEFSFDVKKYIPEELIEGRLIKVPVLAKQSKLYTFISEDAGMYEIKSYGDLKGRITLYDSEFNKITSSFEDGNDSFNLFCNLITSTLYYTAIDCYATGEFSFDIKKFIPEKVEENSPVEVLDSAKQRLLYEFIPEDGGIYKIESYGNLNTIIILSDNEFNKILSNDDSGPNLNSKQWYYLEEASSYHIEVYSYDDGEFFFDIEKYPLEAVTEGNLLEKTMLEGDSFLYSFTSEDGGIYKIESYGKLDTLVVLYDNQFNKISINDDSGQNLNFKQWSILEASSLYYIEVYSYSTGKLTFDIKKYTPESALEGRFITLSTMEGQSLYIFDSPEKGLYNIKSYGTLATQVTLYDEEFNEIAASSSGGIYENFNLQISLEARTTYYIEVGSYFSGVCAFVVAKYSPEEITEGSLMTVGTLATESRLYSFNSEDGGLYKIESYGNLNTLVVLFDSEFNVIAINDAWGNHSFNPSNGAWGDNSFNPSNGAWGDNSFNPSNGAWGDNSFNPSNGAWSDNSFNPSNGAGNNNSFNPSNGAGNNNSFNPSNGAGNNNFKLWHYLEASSTYYIEVYSYSTGEWTFDIEKYLPEEVTEGSLVEVETLEKESMLYECTLGEAGLYKIEFYGELNALVTLYDSEFNKITSNKEGKIHCFRTWFYSETASSYYIEVYTHTAGDASFDIVKYLPEIVTEGSTKGVSILAKQPMLYEFMSGERGPYKIESNGDLNTLLILYDSDFKVIALKDDGGRGKNFKLWCHLGAASSYYLEVYSHDTGILTFEVEKFLPEIVENSTLEEVESLENRSTLFEFNPGETGIYKIEFYGDLTGRVTLYDSEFNRIAFIEGDAGGANFNVGASSNGGASSSGGASSNGGLSFNGGASSNGGASFKLFKTLAGSASYYIEVELQSVDSGNFGFDVKKYSKITVEEGPLMEVEASEARGILYSFNPMGEYLYKIEVYGDANLLLVLYDSEFNRIQLREYAGESEDFKWLIIFGKYSLHYIEVLYLSPPSDFSFDIHRVVEINEETIKTGLINEEKTKFFSFTPDEEGPYAIQFYGGLSVNVALYDSQLKQIAYDADGARPSFFLNVNLSAGTTYYIEVRSSLAGMFAFDIQKYTPGVALEGDLLEIHILKNHKVFFSFTPDETWVYKIESDASFVEITLYDSEYNPIDLDPFAGSGNSSKLWHSLEALTLYYIEITSNTTGEFTFKVEKIELVEEGGEKEVAIEEGELMLYAFVSGGEGLYNIESFGNLDTIITLYDGELRQIAYDNDGGTNDNFKLRLELAGSTLYYIKISSLESGEFFFKVERVVSIEEGSLEWVAITEEGQSIIYAFIPGVAGRYKIESYGDLIVKVTMYDHELNQIIHEEGNASLGNFALLLNLEFYTLYYIEVTSVDIGEFSFRISLVTEIVEGRLQEISACEGQSILYEFIPTRSGLHNIEYSGNLEMLLTLYDSNHTTLAYGYYGGSGDNFQLWHYLKGYTSYYIQVSFYEAGTFSFSVEDTSPAEVMENVAKEVSIEGGQSKLWTFIPTGSGIYNIESYGNLWERIVLYDSEYRQIACDNYDYSGKNFQLWHYLQGGETYYIEVSSYSAGSFEFDVKKVVYEEVFEDDLKATSIIEGKSRLWTFIPEETGVYSLEIDADLSLSVALYDSEYNLITSGLNFFPYIYLLYDEFILKAHLEKSKLYYIEISSSSGTGGFSFEIQKSFPEAVSITKGQTIIREFILDEAGVYDIEFYGNLNMWAYLLDSEENPIAYNESMGGNYNFKFKAQLVASTPYYIKVHSYQTGTFSFDIQKSVPEEVIEGWEKRISIAEDEVKFYPFTPNETGVYSMQFYGDLSTSITLYSVYNGELYEVAYGESDYLLNSELLVSLRGSTVYYIVLDSLDTGEFGFKVEKAAYIEEGIKKEVVITEAQEILYIFAPKETGLYSVESYIESHEDLSIFAYLMDFDGSIITTVYGEVNCNFKLWAHLEEETFYLLLVSFSGGGTFSFDVKKSVVEGIEEGIKKELSIAEDQSKLYAFIPEETGVYDLQFYGDLTPGIALYDDELNLIAYGQEDFPNYNLKLWAYLEGSTLYYIQVFSSEMGMFSLDVQKIEKIEEGLEKVISVIEGQSMLYVFTPEETGIYDIQSYGNLGGEIILYDNHWNQITYDNDGDPNFNFKLWRHFEDSTEYYLRVFSYGTGAFSFDIKKRDVEGVEEGVKKETSILAGQSILYAFTLEGAGLYTLESYGHLDTQVAIYDSELNLIAHSKDGGTGENFKLWIHLTPSTSYYIRVFSYGTGEFSFDIKKRDVEEVEEGQLKLFSSTESQSLLYTFVPEEKGFYNIGFYDNFGTEVAIYDNEWKLIAHSKPKEGFLDLILCLPLGAGKIYYIEIHSEDIVELFFEVKKSVIEEIKEDSFQKVAITEGQSISLAFTPKETGVYNIESYGNLNTEVCIFDSELNLIAQSNDGGTGENFKLLTHLEGETLYYFLVSSFETGIFNFDIQKSFLEEIPIAKGQSILREFTPKESGVYDIKFYGELEGLQVTIYDSELNQIIHNKSVASTFNFILTTLFEAQTLYYIEVFSDEAGTFNFDIQKSLVLELEVGREKAVLGVEGESNFYAFIPGETGIYSMSSYEGFGVLVALYDSDFSLIACDNDASLNSNFKFFAHLEGNALYYLKASFYRPLTFSFLIKKRVVSELVEGMEKEVAIISQDEPILFTFIPGKAGVYNIKSFRHLGTELTLYDSEFNPINYGQINENFKLLAYLVPSVTYYVEVLSHNLGNFKIKVEKVVEIEEERKEEVSFIKGESMLYAFTPEETGLYSISAHGNLRTEVTLYDSELNQITYNNNPLINGNFTLWAHLEESTSYYILLQSYGKGTMGLLVKKSAAFEIEVGQEEEVSILAGQTILYVFTPGETGIYDMSSYGSISTRVTLCDGDLNVITYINDSGPNYSYKLFAHLEGNNFYYLQLSSYEEGTFNFIVEKSVVLEVEEGREEEVVLIEGEQTTYAFTSEEAGLYNIESFGNLGTEVTLYDGNLTQIKYGVGGGINDNFKLLTYLEVQTLYYLKVFSNTIGEFSFKVEKVLEIEEGQEKEVSILAGQSILYAFTPKDAGLYSIESHEDLATEITIYDGNLNRMNYNVGAGINVNFKLFAYLEGNTLYYLQVSSSETGTFSFDVKKSILEGLEEGVEKTISILAGQSILYTFTPEEAGLYSIESYEDLGTRVVLYDGKLRQINYNNDCGLNGNFKLFAYLEGNTLYYLQVSSSETGAFSFDIKKSVLEGEGLEAGVEKAISIVAGQSILYAFTPEELGLYSIESFGDLGTEITLYDGKLNPINYNNDGGIDDNFKLWAHLEGKTLYYLQVFSSRTGDFSFKVERVLKIKEGKEEEAFIMHGRSVLYTFIPEETGLYNIGSYGNLDTFITLSDGNFNLIAFDDDRGLYGNFILSVHLEALTLYYLRMSSYEGNNFKFKVEKVFEIEKRVIQEVSAIEGGSTLYAFIPEETGGYNIESYGNLKTEVTLYDGVLNQIANNISGGINENFKLLSHLEAQTLYYIRVSSYGTGDFSFLIKKSLLEGLEEGKEKEVSIMQGQLIRWTFIPEETGLYNIESHGNLNTRVSIYDSELNLIAHSSEGGIDENFKLLAHLGGEALYYIEVSSFTTGDFNFIVEKSSKIEVESIETVSILSGQSIFWTFTPGETGFYNIESFGNLNTQVFIYDSEFNLIDLNSGGGINGNFKVLLHLEGESLYYVEVFSFDAGDFSFKVEKISRIEDGSIMEVSILEGQSILWTFVSGKIGLYNTKTYGYLNTQIALYDSNFNLIMKDCDLVLHLEGQTLYYVEVFSFDTGEFSFKVEKVVEIEEGLNEVSIASGESILYEFTPGKTGFYTIESHGNLSTLTALLYDGDWNEIAEGGLGHDFELLICLKVSTIYYIEVYSSETGDFILNVEKIAKVKEENFEEVSITASQLIFYEFTPKETGAYSIESYGDLNTFVILYDSNFNEIASSYYAWSPKNFKLWETLEGNTSYCIMVSSYETGEFIFSIEKTKEIKEGELLEVDILKGQEAIYAFTSGEAGFYSIETYGELDIFVILYDSEHNELMARDNYLLYEFDESTLYYIGVYAYEIGAFNFKVDKISQIQEGVLEEGSARAGQEKLYKFTPRETALFNIEFFGNFAMDVYLFDSELNPIDYIDYSDIDSQLWINLEASILYYLVVYFRDASEFGFKIEKVAKIEGNVFEDAHILAGQSTLYEFSLGEIGVYIIQAYGSIDTRVTLYDRDLNPITYSSSNVINHNFKLWNNLTTNTLYYIKVFSQDAGEFSVKIEKEENIESGSVQEVSIMQGQVKMYKFIPGESRLHNIESYGALDTRLYLYDSEHNLIEHIGDGGSGRNFQLWVHLEKEILYYIVVYSYNTGKFSIKAADISEIVEGNLLEVVNSKYHKTFYTFTPTEKGLYSIQSYGNLDTWLVLYDRDHNLIDYSQYGGSASNSQLWAYLEESFLYYIEVASYDIGEFSFEVEKVKEIEEGELIDVAILKYHKTYYLFTPEEKGVYVIKSYGDLDTRVYLYDSNLNQIAYSYYGGSAKNFQLNTYLSRGLSYYIGVSSVDTGPFNFRIEKVVAIEEKIGKEVAIIKGQSNMYAFIPEETALYNIKSFGSLDTRVTLYDSNLQLIAYNDDCASSSNFNMLAYLEVETLYYIEVSSYGTGEFTFKVEKVYEIEEGSLEEGTITSGQSTLYKVTLEEAGLYSIESFGNLDTRVTLYDSEFNQIAVSSEGGSDKNFQLWWHLVNDTTYFIEVSSLNTGELSFKIEKVIEIEEATLIEISITAGQSILYAFTPTEEGVYVIKSYGDLDTIVTLYDSELNEIDYDSDGGVHANFKLRSTLEASTSYYLRIFSNNTGEFSFNVKKEA